MSDYIINDEWIHDFMVNIEELIDESIEYEGYKNPVPPLREIVRCKDCKYYDGEPDMESMGEKCWRDPNHTGRSAPTVTNGYCWRGERREQ